MQENSCNDGYSKAIADAGQYFARTDAEPVCTALGGRIGGVGIVFLVEEVAEAGFYSPAVVSPGSTDVGQQGVCSIAVA